MNRTAASLIHLSAGLVALALALFYLFSDTLSFDLGGPLSAYRPKIVVFIFFAIAAWSLIMGAERSAHRGQRVAGYASAGLGLATVWLIFSGSDISSQ